MDVGAPPSAPETIGRADELARLRSFVAGAADRAVVIVGPPGVGKTTIWEAGLSMALANGARVLSARAAEAESHLPFTTLSDLVGRFDLADIPRLPAPQRRALDVALVRAEPGEQPPTPRATALAILHVLEALADDAPVVLAIDDVHWADSASIEAVAFALRRARASSIRVLLARRPGPATAIEAALRLLPTDELRVDGLSLGATRHLLASRLGLTLTRRVLRQLHETTLGNPLFALELGRSFQLHGSPAIGEELRLPESLDSLLQANLPGQGARALLAVALHGPITSSMLAGLVGEAALDDAVAAGLLLRVGDHLRPAHPLLAAAAIERASAAERRDLHRSLARATDDPVRRARHIAAVSFEPDAALATIVDSGALAATRRGATVEAIELAEHALRLTPAGDPARDARVISLGERLAQAEEMGRLREMLEIEFETLSPGLARARGHLLMSQVPTSQAEFDAHLASAIRESEDAPGARALALAAQARDHAVAYLEKLDEAEAKAGEALSIAPDRESRGEALNALGWVRILRGIAIDDLRPRSPDDESADLDYSHARLEAIRLAFRGELEAARPKLEDGLDRARELGQHWAWGSFALQLCELALRAGDHRAIDRWIHELDSFPSSFPISVRSTDPRVRALAAAIKGDAATATRLIDSATALVHGQRWDAIELDRARGLAALAAGRPEDAIQPLLGVWQHLVAEGIDDPGAFPVAPDLVEAALMGNRPELAREVLGRLARLSREQEHPWGLASTLRCEALGILVEQPGSDAAHGMLRSAADGYLALGCRFDAARTYLVLGRYARRGRKWAVARNAIQSAIAIFDELGCEGWLALARSSLDAVGGRRPAADRSLTPSERRVVALASAGRSNKEIAASLYVSEHTVEVHLTHAFQKLGVTSRVQLATVIQQLEARPAASNV